MGLFAYRCRLRSGFSARKFHTHIFLIKEWRFARIKELFTSVSAEEGSRAIDTSRQILSAHDFFPFLVTGAVGSLADGAIDVPLVS